MPTFFTFLVTCSRFTIDPMKNTSQLGGPDTIVGHSLEPLINEYEYSRITGRSVASARRDRLLGKGCPYIKQEHLVRYRPSDVREYIERNRRGGKEAR